MNNYSITFMNPEKTFYMSYGINITAKSFSDVEKQFLKNNPNCQILAIKKNEITN